MTKKLTTPILLVDSPEKCADLRHASGFWAPDPLVFLDTPRGAFLMVSMLEQGRAMELARTRPAGRLQVLTPGDLRLKGPRRRALAEWALALLRHAGVRHVQVPTAFPLGTARLLEARGVRVDVVREALYPARVVKSAAERAQIAESQRAAVAGLRAAVQLLRAAHTGPRGLLKHGGRVLTAERVKLAIQQALLARDTFCRDVIVAGGAQGADPHERGHGPLHAGQPIVLDIFPQHLGHGYWGDLTRTVVKGRASPELRRMYRAVQRAQGAALRQLRAGAALKRVHTAVTDVFARARYETRVLEGRPEGFIHSTGHGVGLEIHEAPTLAPVAGRLRAGSVVTVEPGLYYAALGGVRIEDTVLVTRRGYELLAPCPAVFELR